jgi:hypothetical protein
MVVICFFNDTASSKSLVRAILLQTVSSLTESWMIPKQGNLRSKKTSSKGGTNEDEQECFDEDSEEDEL